MGITTGGGNDFPTGQKQAESEADGLYDCINSMLQGAPLDLALHCTLAGSVHIDTYGYLTDCHSTLYADMSAAAYYNLPLAVDGIAVTFPPAVGTEIHMSKFDEVDSLSAPVSAHSRNCLGGDPDPYGTSGDAGGDPTADADGVDFGGTGTFEVCYTLWLETGSVTIDGSSTDDYELGEVCDTYTYTANRLAPVGSHLAAVSDQSVSNASSLQSASSATPAHQRTVLLGLASHLPGGAGVAFEPRSTNNVDDVILVDTARVNLSSLDAAFALAQQKAGGNEVRTTYLVPTISQPLNGFASRQGQLAALLDLTKKAGSRTVGEHGSLQAIRVRLKP